MLTCVPLNIYYYKVIPLLIISILEYRKHYKCITLYPPETSLNMKDNTNLNDIRTHCTTSDMTANPEYDTTSGIMANLSSTTTAKIWAAQNEESIVMSKNPTYATAAETSMARGN